MFLTIQNFLLLTKLPVYRYNKSRKILENNDFNRNSFVNYIVNFKKKPLPTVQPNQNLKKKRDSLYSFLFNTLYSMKKKFSLR